MKKQLVLASAIACLCATGATQAGLITFEGLAAGTDVSTVYQASDGVVFSSTTSGGGGPKVGNFGGPAVEGWVYNPNIATNTPDFLLPGEGVNNGQNFITDIIGIKPANVNLTVQYLNPVAALSFDLFDIDGNQAHVNDPESYAISIYDASMALLDTISVTAGGIDSFGDAVGDGISSRFGFSRGSNDVSYLIINGFRTNGGFGLGFDNFATDRFTNNVPEPATLGLLGLGLLGLGLSRRKRI